MSRARIGELLGRMGKLTPLDIDEILQEQGGSGRRRFGEIALTWGLIEPEHIWQAWCDQLDDGLIRVDLDEVGVDTQAAYRMPRELADRYCAIPVRLLNDQVIVAVSDADDIARLGDLAGLLHARPKFVLADTQQIRLAVAQYCAAASPAVAVA